MRKNKSFIVMVILPCIYSVLFLIIFLFCQTEIKSLFADQLQSIFFSSAPEYQYEKQLSVEKNVNKREFFLEGEQYGEILCEKIDMRVPLYYGDNEKILEQGAGTWKAGSIPGKQGVTLIGAHDTTFFKNLGELKTGDKLTVNTGYGTTVYHVTGTEIVRIKDDTIDKQLKEYENKDILILYTCYPFQRTDKEREERYFVYAQP